MTSRRPIALSALQGLIPVLDEPVSVSLRGFIIGVWHPISVPDSGARRGRGLSEYRPEATTYDGRKRYIE